MKILITYIIKCGECPYWIMAGNPFYCTLNKRDITAEDFEDLKAIPDWCPLPDALLHKNEAVAPDACKVPKKIGQKRG